MAYVDKFGLSKMKPALKAAVEPRQIKYSAREDRPFEKTIKLKKMGPWFPEGRWIEAH